MRTTVILEDNLVLKAKEYTGINKTSALLTYALEDLNRKEAALRLAELGGSMADLDITSPPRRRF